MRDAYRAADSWGPDVPPPLPAAPRPRRRVRVLAPLGAAVAVGAVVAGAVVAGVGEPERTPPGPVAPAATPYVLMTVSRGLSVVDSRTGLVPHAPVPPPEKAGGAKAAYNAVTRGAGAGEYLASISTLVRAPTRRTPPKSSSRVYRVTVTGDGRAEIGAPLDWTIPGVLREMALSPDGRRLAYLRAMDEGPKLGVLDLASKRHREWPVRTAGIPDTTKSLAWRADGLEVVFTRRGTVRGLDPATGRERTLVPATKAPGGIDSAVPDADGLTVAVVNGKRVRLFQYRGGRWSKPLVTIPGCGGVAMFTRAGDGRTLLLGRDAAACSLPIRLYAVQDGQVRRIFKSDGTFASVAW
ncbi:hypothetical protein [Actinomadura hibisca]|uniref:hypothetical protein n=1 Tax=Actinomadura hibisca TaxID=68565 RepID=UPI0012FA5DC8|nr:hypothetical protein [Actinomadura hibisca]